ncbi:MAG: NAD(+)/NADH kinase [candidate division KSB1 bacterium]|nr:NAD(+)/NADH kinase [candidate division KSB1 bacterium]MDZ7345618.1 NAD(+)/NADH kinase [candidate division KSB1 bacterium]
MKLGIIANIQKPKAVAAAKTFAALLQTRNLDYFFSEDLKRFLDSPEKERVLAIERLAEICDVLATFGGDGTILSTARQVGAAGKPILGINIGTLGFLAEVLMEEVEQTLDDLIAGRYTLIDRMALRITVERKYLRRTFYALNDVVVDRGPTTKLIYIDARVNGRFLNSYRADGLIVATPTGSTAYSLSAGGPLLMPTMNALIVTPICPHSLSVRPIVLTDDCIVELSIRKEAEPVQINIDGQNQCQLLAKERLLVAKAEYSVKWISIGQRDFFAVLRSKLNWGSENNSSISDSKQSK